jgi:hypothetical protein
LNMDELEKAQRHKGTKAQRHRGTEAQRHRGTEAQSLGLDKNPDDRRLKEFVGVHNFSCVLVF